MSLPSLSTTTNVGCIGGTMGQAIFGSCRVWHPGASGGRWNEINEYCQLTPSEFRMITTQQHYYKGGPPRANT